MIVIDKRDFYKEIVLIIVAVLACFIICLNSSIIWHISAMVFVSFVAMLLVGFDLMHPYVWFTGFFCLYSIGYPLMVLIGYGTRIEYTKESMLLQLLALIVFLLVTTPHKNDKVDQVELTTLSFDLGLLNRIIYILLIVLVLLGGALVIKNGFSGKADVYETGGIFLKMIFRTPLILSMFYAISVITSFARNGKFPLSQMLITMSALLFITLFSGERDFIFRFVILNVFIMWFLKALKLKHLFILGPIAMIGIVLSSNYKYYFLTGNISRSNGGFLHSLIAGEFESASRNLQELINNASYTKGVKGFRQIAFDVMGSVYSGYESTTSWFTNTFYPNSVTQYGFTLVGEGYVIAGVFGIIVLFLIVGLITKWFYMNASNSNYKLAAYMYFITVVIYSIRADLSTILAGIVKQIYLVLLILYIAENLSKIHEVHYE